jgi:N utilization substance protein B
LTHQDPPGMLDFDPDDVVAREVIEHTEATNERSAIRRIALQILYEIDSSGHRPGDVIGVQVIHNGLNDDAARILRQLVTGVLGNKKRLDIVIQQFASEWPLEQVAIIDRNILRMAVYEFAIQLRTPIKVAISEAVELAHLFGAEGTPRFVNGVLGSLASDRDTLQKLLKEHSKEA